MQCELNFILLFPTDWGTSRYLPNINKLLLLWYCYDVQDKIKKEKYLFYIYIYLSGRIFTQISFRYRFLDTALYLFSQLHLCSVYTRELLTYRVIIFKYILFFFFLKSVFSHISAIYHYCFAEKLGGMSTGQEIN